MSFATGDVPIKLKSTAKQFDEDIRPRLQTLVQLYDNGEKKKGEVPIFNGGDAEDMIRTIREFKEVADDLDFTEPNEKFVNFRKCLREVARDDWDTVRAQYPVTIGGFTGSLYSWKEMIIPEDMYEVQKNYIETVKKPFTMPVRDFVKRIRQLASFLPEFPKPPAASGLSDTDLKNIIFRGMPSTWQENFVHANMRISTITLAQMTDYLASEQSIADTRRDRTSGGRGRSSNRNGSRDTAPGRGRGYQGRGSSRSSGRGGRSSGFKRRGSDNNHNSNTSRNAAINDPCRYHGNAHPWKMCYGNPDGPNFRPGFQPKTQGTTGRGRGNGGRFHPGRGNGGGRNDAYQQDHASNAGQSTAVSASSITTHPPAVAPAYRWTSPDANGRVPTYLPNPAGADNHWIDSVGATEDE